MCHSLQRPHLSGVLWGGSEFSSVVKIFLENVAHLGPFFFGEKKKNGRSGLGTGMSNTYVYRNSGSIFQKRLGLLEFCA